MREDEALDWFQVAASEAEDPAIRASASAYVAAILLVTGRPWEVDVWAELVRRDGATPDLGNLLEAMAKLQLGEVDAARSLLALAREPADPWFPTSVTSARMAGAHVAYLDGEVEAATREVMEIFELDRFAPDVWDALARLCAETDFDPAGVVAHVPDDRTLEVLAALRNSAPVGVDRIAQLIWERNTGDARVLALVPSFAAKLDSLRAMEWSGRLRATGMGRLCPLLDRAESERVDAPERARAAALAHASFGDKRAREALARAVPRLTDDELIPTFREVWAIAAMLADTVVVAGSLTPVRSLLIATALFQGGARAESYAVLVHALSLEDAEHLTTEEVMRCLPVPVLDGLASEAEARGEEDVAGILEAVLVVAGGL